jgi:hypothetical protein
MGRLRRRPWQRRWRRRLQMNWPCANCGDEYGFAVHELENSDSQGAGPADQNGHQSGRDPV